MDITIRRGITHAPLLAIFSDDNGNQVDLSTWGVEAFAAKKPGKEPVLDLAPVILQVGDLLGYDGEVDGPGRVKFADFSDEQTIAMVNVSLVWDMVLLPPDGRRLYPGAFGGCKIITIVTPDA